jgi:cyclophilin family peptidyl-prolyl cis-trans isomerase
MRYLSYGLALFASLQAGMARSPAVAEPAPDSLEAEVTTDAGTFRFEFLGDKAPKHVANFIALARHGYYNGSAFHRAIPGGLIQGGDPLLKIATTPRNRWGAGMGVPIASEATNATHEAGIVSAVAVPNKAGFDGVQFFVCVTPQYYLDGKYTPFGRVTEGMSVVKRISEMPPDDEGLLEKPVRIIKITIEPKHVEPFATASIGELRRTVTLKTTLGAMEIKMEPDWAPETVRAFLNLVASGWYDGTTFQRLVKGFVLQGGTGGTRSSGPEHYADRWVHPLKAEFRPEIKHVRGVISMAHYDNDPNSGTTSFSIIFGKASHLDGKYAAFGHVVNGMDVLAAFEQEPVSGDAPIRRLEIIKATVNPQ